MKVRLWLIDEIAPDFDLLDVWPLPVQGGRDDFPALVEVVESFDPAAADSFAVRALFAVRLLLGRVFGWDDNSELRTIPGSSEASLIGRVPDALRGSAGKATATRPFVPLYRAEDEWAAEISNDTVHGVLHLAWVDQGGGRYHGRLSIYVKPRGRLGRLYLLAIKPFRHLIVYPALLRQIGRAWQTGGRES